MIFAIVVGAVVFAHYLTLTKFPQFLSKFVLTLGTNKGVYFQQLLCIAIMYGRPELAQCGGPVLLHRWLSA
jgi:TRAP-type C4-dicarboxylate transport system permease large subunit